MPSAMPSDEERPVQWIELSVLADGEAAEAVSELFNRFNGRPDGQGGAVIEVGGFDPVGENHHPVAIVRTYLPVDAPDTPERQRQIEQGMWFLQRIYPVGELISRPLAEEDWANAWKAHYAPLRLGEHFLIIPAWQVAQVTPQPDDQVLILDPGMAFGTGLHPSTQLCLAGLESVIHPGTSVLDAGCGSGILSIAAARLGARHIDAFDIDPLAITATRENARLNELAAPINVFESSGPDESVFWSASPRWQVILINILLPVIIGLLDRGIANYLAPDGKMVLAGVIVDQEAKLNDALAAKGLVVIQRRVQGDWLSVVVTAAA
jgi:ribosomal protein L11 methyltransferase